MGIVNVTIVRIFFILILPCGVLILVRVMRGNLEFFIEGIRQVVNVLCVLKIAYALSIFIQICCLWGGGSRVGESIFWNNCSIIPLYGLQAVRRCMFQHLVRRTNTNIIFAKTRLLIK